MSVNAKRTAAVDITLLAALVIPAGIVRSAATGPLSTPVDTTAEPARKAPVNTAITELTFVAVDAGSAEQIAQAEQVEQVAQGKRVEVSGRLVEVAALPFPFSRMPVSVEVTDTATARSDRCTTTTDSRGMFRCSVAGGRNSTVRATFAGNTLLRPAVATYFADSAVADAPLPDRSEQGAALGRSSAAPAAPTAPPRRQPRKPGRLRS